MAVLKAELQEKDADLKKAKQLAVQAELRSNKLKKDVQALQQGKALMQIQLLGPHCKFFGALLAALREFIGKTATCCEHLSP